MKVNDRIIWMKYGRTGDISETGFGMVLEIYSIDCIIILCDTGEIKRFNPEMIRPFEDWDE